MTLGMLIFRANGFKDSASSDIVVTYRDEKGLLVKTVVHFPNVFCGPKNPDPFFLKDGDEVFVPDRDESNQKS